jgi:hypothetical protein
MERMKVFIDSDIFIRDLRYQRDQKFRENSFLLEQVYKRKLKGFTSIYNLLEICGVLSFNLSEESLFGLYAGFRDRYNLQIIFPKGNGQSVCFLIEDILSLMSKKLSFGDALITSIVEQNSKGLDKFVSWNAEHFKDKLSIEAITPLDIS